MSRVSVDTLLQEIYANLVQLEDNVVNAVYFSIAPEDTTPPFILFTHIESTPNYLMQDRYLDRHNLQINIYSNNPSVSEVLSIGNQVDNLMYRFSKEGSVVRTIKYYTHLGRDEDLWIMVLRYMVDVISE